MTDDASHGAQNPQLAFGERHIYVSDPAQGQVNVVDLERGEVVRRIAVGGVPAKLAVLRPKTAYESAH